MGDRLDGVRVTDAECREIRKARGKGGESERADDDPDEHKAEHRTDAQAMKQRDDDGRCAEDDECRFVQRKVERR
jgi:hypothetical protein